MLGQFIVMEIPILLLMVLVGFFIFKDKIFYGKIRTGIITMVALQFILICISIAQGAGVIDLSTSNVAIRIMKILIRFFIYGVMLSIVLRKSSKTVPKLIWYGVAVIYSFGVELIHGSTLLADNIMVVMVTAYYFYLLTNAYKGKMKNENVWDDMTGLYNLNGFVEELDNLKRLAIIDNTNIWLIAIDVKRLVNINNAHGYAEGNMVIKALADIISNSLEPRQYAGHPGADEFVVALKAIPDNEDKKNDLIARVNAGIHNSSAFDGKDYTVEIYTASEEFVPLEMKSGEECVNKILNAKQESKTTRRINGIDDKGNKSAAEKDEEKRVLDVINGNKLNYAFQPIVSAKDGTIVAYEALMRPDTNPFVSPLTLLRHAENLNKNYDIERLTFSNVLKIVSEKDYFKSGDRKIFINSIPGYILNDEDYEKISNEYKGIFKSLVVEITEQSELSENDLFKLIDRAQKDGFDMAIDDYGSGTANTYSLLRIRPHIIKLDRLLVSDIDKNTKKQYFVNSIVTFAKQNGMEVLAEGVETLEEMKMVIRLQVDYIQGYYTSRPAFEILDEINEDIKRSIVNENIKGAVEAERKVYVVNEGWELSLVQLALEEYTGITVANNDLKIVGNSDYTADMAIKIKDGLDCRLTLRNVKLCSVDDLPCIELGEGTHLTLMIEGDCQLDQKGIRVPEGSSITIKGNGNLTINTKGHACYGIGGGVGETFGNITLNSSGKITVRVDGEEAVAIGGGTFRTGTGINVGSGELDIQLACILGVGIGCYYGDVPINLKDFSLKTDLRVNEGIGIGSFYGKQSVEISGFIIETTGSGSKLSAIGSVGRSGGFVQFREGTLDIALSGQEVGLIAVKNGQLSVSSRNCKFTLKGEGNAVCAIGSTDKTSSSQLIETSLSVTINAAEAIVHGAQDENVQITGATPVYKVNE